jgi:hypothetical protein
MGVYLTSADDVVKGWIGDRGIAEGVGPCAIANAKEKEGDVWRDEWVSGGRRIWPERPVADRRRLTAVGETPVSCPHHLSPIKSKTQKCPRRNSTGLWQLYSLFPRMVPSGPRRTINSTCAPLFFFGSSNPYLATPQPSVLQLLQARCVLRGAITGHLGPYLPGPFESSHYRRCQYRETRIVGLYG